MIPSMKNKYNFKLTSARKALLEILQNATRPLSYEDIKDKISMDKATFYRNILKFEEENIVSSFESHDKKRYFEISKPQHAHFVCTKCNEVKCMDYNLNLDLKNHTVENIIITGLCEKC
jgi:Fur family ferric uptake transcriptional regulator